MWIHKGTVGPCFYTCAVLQVFLISFHRTFLLQTLCKCVGGGGWGVVYLLCDNLKLNTCILKKKKTSGCGFLRLYIVKGTLQSDAHFAYQHFSCAAGRNIRNICSEIPVACVSCWPWMVGAPPPADPGSPAGHCIFCRNLLTQCDATWASTSHTEFKTDLFLSACFLLQSHTYFANFFSSVYINIYACAVNSICCSHRKHKSTALCKFNERI